MRESTKQRWTSEEVLNEEVRNANRSVERQI